MAVDEVLAERVREALHGRGVAFEEKRMFGSLVLMVGGKIALGVRGDGGILVRCAQEESEALLARKGVQEARMGQRPMGGEWLAVDAAAVLQDEALSDWVEVALRRAAGSSDVVE